jgi:hypothetical protein
MDQLDDVRDQLKRELRTAVAADPLAALRAIGALKNDLVAQQGDAVRAALRQHSWSEVGGALGVSKQAAHQKFAKVWATELKEQLKAEQRAIRAALAEGAPDRAAAARARRDAIVSEFKSAGRRRN